MGQIPLPPSNVTFDLFRGSNSASPYTLGALVQAGVAGTLQGVVRSGRNGAASWLKWTHLLTVALGLDIRDAYNSQLDPSRNDALADTVILYDSTSPTRKVAYYVVYVERVANQLQVYLDRFQPSAWPNDAL